MRPTDVNGINKVAGEYYHLVYNNVFGVRACSLRLTNVYGPRQLIRHNRQGFIGWFIRLALEDEEIQIFGDGSQIARLRLRRRRRRRVPARRARRRGATARCSTSAAASRSASASWSTLLIEVAGTGRCRFVDWPAEKKAIDIGSFYADSTKFQPRDRLAAGASACARASHARSRYYRAHFGRYVDEPALQDA